jgi:hypothetical protein
VWVTTRALEAGETIDPTNTLAIGRDRVIAAFRVHAGALRPVRGSTVTLVAARRLAEIDSVEERAVLLSMAPNGDASTTLVALAPASATRLAGVSDRTIELLAPTGN